MLCHSVYQTAFAFPHTHKWQQEEEPQKDVINALTLLRSCFFDPIVANVFDNINELYSIIAYFT